MSAGTLDDTRAPSFEVRIYRDDELLLRAFCESPEEATALASQGSGPRPRVRARGRRVPDAGPR